MIGFKQKHTISARDKKRQIAVVCFQPNGYRNENVITARIIIQEKKDIKDIAVDVRHSYSDLLEYDSIDRARSFLMADSAATELSQKAIDIFNSGISDIYSIMSELEIELGIEEKMSA